MLAYDNYLHSLFKTYYMLYSTLVVILSLVKPYAWQLGFRRIVVNPTAGMMVLSHKGCTLFVTALYCRRVTSSAFSKAFVCIIEACWQVGYTGWQVGISKNNYLYLWLTKQWISLCKFVKNPRLLIENRRIGLRQATISVRRRRYQKWDLYNSIFYSFFHLSYVYLSCPRNFVH